MNRKLWETVNRFVDKDTAEIIFLPLNMIVWLVTALVAGTVICFVLRQPIAACLTKIMCAAVYSSILIGLAGGILFMRRLGRR